MKYTLWPFHFILCAIFAIPCFAREKEVAPNTSMEAFAQKIKTMAEQEKSFIPDVKRKEQECIDLVTRGAVHLAKTNLETACYDFVYANEWRRGEIFNIILDEEGHIMCHGDTNSLIWKNINGTVSFINEPIMNTIKKVTPEGQWIHYKWNNGFKFVYMKKIIIEDLIYYVGAGFFPHDKEYIAEQLVKTAIAYFKQVPQGVAFTRISNTNDAFVLGNVSTYVGDFEGNIWASSTDTAYTGQNLLNFQDVKGEYPIKKIINILKTNTSGWLTYYWLGELQNNYIEKIHDSRNNKDYFFVGAYMPNVDEIFGIDLLNRAVKHVEKVGMQEAAGDFSNSVGEFAKSATALFAYDFNGTNLADGEYPVLVGQNLFNRKDGKGKLIVQEIIAMAKKYGQGVIITYDKNSYKKLFIKVVNTHEGQYIIGTGIYTQTKKVSVEAIVEKGLRFLKEHTLVESMDAFSNNQGEFYLGDLYLFLITNNGMFLVNGEHKDLAWTVMNKAQIGNADIGQKMIQLAENGGGWLKYIFRNAEKRVLVRPFIQKSFDGKKEEMGILGCGYYL